MACMGMATRNNLIIIILLLFIILLLLLFFYFILIILLPFHIMFSLSSPVSSTVSLSSSAVSFPGYPSILYPQFPVCRTQASAHSLQKLSAICCSTISLSSTYSCGIFLVLFGSFEINDINNLST